MYKKDIIDAIQKVLVNEDGKPAYSKKEIAEVTKAYEEVILDTLRDGNDVNITGFANFKIVERSAREGVTPFNGKTWSKPAGKTVSIKPSMVMKKLFE